MTSLHGLHGLDASEVRYVVQVLRSWDGLAAGPFAIGGMAGAEGCTGFLPVFADLEHAVDWRDENHPDAGITAMTTAKIEVTS